METAMPTIAVIGASNDRTKYGNRAVRAYQARGWTVYPVNLREKLIEASACSPPSPLAAPKSCGSTPARAAPRCSPARSNLAWSRWRRAASSPPQLTVDSSGPDE
jgi:hypothetical protein